MRCELMCEPNTHAVIGNVRLRCTCSNYMFVRNSNAFRLQTRFISSSHGLKIGLESGSMQMEIWSLGL